ncbi:14010_t:CDS:2, partial [Cetraspora pellucida]
MQKRKSYSQRNHLKKARSIIRKSSKKQINNEDTIESNISSLPNINSIDTSTEIIINTIASQTEVIVNTVATQTEVTVSTITTQTEAIIIQSNEMQIDQVNQAEDLSTVRNQINNVPSNLLEDLTQYGKLAADKLFDKLFD